MLYSMTLCIMVSRVPVYSIVYSGISCAYVQYVLCILISYASMYTCTVFSDRLPNRLNQCIMYGISTLHVSHFVNILYIAMATCYP